MLSKEKIQCEKCKKKFRKSKVKKSKHSGKMLCTLCRRNEVTNIFYIPQRKKDLRGKTIGKYTMTDTEKRLLRKNLMNKGLSSQEANLEIAKKIGIMQSIKKQKQARAIQFEYQRRDSRKQQEAFVKGLRQ